MRNDEKAMYATTVRAFSSLFKHDCDPNVELFTSKCSTTIGYAIKPIKKGTPVSLFYYNNNITKCVANNSLIIFFVHFLFLVDSQLLWKKLYARSQRIKTRLFEKCL